MSEIISTVDFLVEEEAQVVPSSLDHLSRHELCHMIYRLDYERHTLKEKLVALRHAFSAVKNNNNNASLGGGPPGGGGVKRRRTRQLPPQLPHKRKSETTSSQQNKNTQQQQQQPEEKKKTAVAAPSTKRQKKSNQNDHESAATASTTTTTTQPIKSMTPSEMDAIHKRLTEKVTSQIKSSVHGGLRRPRTVAEETGISLTTAMYIMEKWKRKLTQDTNRIVKWEFKSPSTTSSSSVYDNSKNIIHINTDDDDDISKFLLCEKYLSGVRHNGKGFLSIGRNNHNNNGGSSGGGGGSSSNGGGFLLKHAKFESMIVSYNKSVQALKIQVSTRGCNEYGKC